MKSVRVIITIIYHSTHHIFGPLRLRNNLYCVGWGVKLYSLTHPVVLERAGTWHHQALEMVLDLGRRATDIAVLQLLQGDHVPVPDSSNVGFANGESGLVSEHVSVSPVANQLFFSPFTAYTALCSRAKNNSPNKVVYFQYGRE